MNMVEIICKKRDKQKLSQEEIEYFITNYTNGTIPDYQASALCMAILLNGMDDEEISQMTMAMAESGETLNLSEHAEFSVDKHSTGGVGDKTTLIVQPIVASCGVAVAKMSGRGLGYSGGTIDKLESIPGMRTDLSKEEFLDQLQTIGSVISGQSKHLAPADGKLYALRDVTGTVPSQALIASSIMSKKLAVSTNAILLDVKVGKGAFMKTVEDATQLARRMVNIGRYNGRIMRAELSDMNQPLGSMVGNILEVKEAIAMLKGEPVADDLYEHCIDSSALLLEMASKAATFEEGIVMAEEALRSGQAFEKLKEMIAAQGGDVSYLDHPEKFPEAPFIETVNAERDGYISEIDAQIVGETSVELGAGRHKKTDTLDYRVGIEIHHKVGDEVKTGDPLFTVHANSSELLEYAKKELLSAHSFSDVPVEKLPQFYGIVEGNAEGNLYNLF